MPNVKGAPRQRAAVERFLETVDAPFRRSNLVKILLPMTSPRSLGMATHIADVLLKELAATGRIQRHGHLHWVCTSSQRQLLDESLVPELGDAVDLHLKTKCPEKWVAIDLETGDVWRGSAKGWRRPTEATLAMVTMAAKRSSKKKRGGL